MFTIIPQSHIQDAIDSSQILTNIVVSLAKKLSDIVLLHQLLLCENEMKVISPKK